MTDSNPYNLPEIRVWPDLPQGRQMWYAQRVGTPFVATGDTRELALANIDVMWNSGNFHIVDAPPPPKRPGDPKPSAAMPNTAIQGDTLATAFHRALLKEFHPDHHGHRSYTGDEIVATINRLWDEAGSR